jgi:hypothetical protein
LTSERNPVTPVLPRSAFDRSADDLGAPHIQVRTRGPRLRQSPVDERSELHVLVCQLRRLLLGVPLNIVLASPDVAIVGTASSRFFESVISCIEPSIDTVWIVNGGAPASPTPGVVSLDTEARDTRIRDNLVADILFLAAEDEGDVDALRRFCGRVSLVIIPMAAPYTEALTETATELDTVTLHWDAAQSTVHLAPGRETVIDVPEGSALTQEEMAYIGDRLGALAKQLTSRRERRATFRDALMGLMRRYDRHPRWSADLIELADKFAWPSWAVQMLPKLYLRTTDGDDQVTAFVWRRLFEWIENHEAFVIGQTLCNGEILPVLIPVHLDALLGEIHAEVEENLRGNPFYYDTVFFGRISDAVSGVGRRSSDPETRKRLLKLSRDLHDMARPATDVS